MASDDPPMEAAPSLEFNGLDGRPLNLDDLRGRPLILVFLRYVG